MTTDTDLLAQAREALAHHEAEEKAHADKATRLRRVIALLEGKAEPQPVFTGPFVVPAQPYPWPEITPLPLPWYVPPQVTPGIVGPVTPWPYDTIICGDPPNSIGGGTITYDPSGGVRITAGSLVSFNSTGGDA